MIVLYDEDILAKTELKYLKRDEWLRFKILFQILMSWYLIGKKRYMHTQLPLERARIKEEALF